MEKLETTASYRKIRLLGKGGMGEVFEAEAPDGRRVALKVFHAETEPLKEFYEKLGVLKLVEGNQPIEDATRDILAALGM